MKKQDLLSPISVQEAAHVLVVFDGFCVLCSATVKFLLKIDKNKILKFTTLHQPGSSDSKEKPGMQAGQPSTVIYMEEGNVYTESEAIVRIFRRIGGVWKLTATLLRLIPRKCRDFIYRLIAKNRYRIFGTKKQCFIAPKEYTDRFIPEIDIDTIKSFL